MMVSAFIISACITKIRKFENAKSADGKICENEIDEIASVEDVDIRIRL